MDGVFCFHCRVLFTGDILKNNYLFILKILLEGDYLFDFSIDTKTLVLVEYCLNH